MYLLWFWFYDSQVKTALIWLRISLLLSIHCTARFKSSCTTLAISEVQRFVRNITLSYWHSYIHTNRTVFYTGFYASLLIYVCDSVFGSKYQPKQKSLVAGRPWSWARSCYTKTRRPDRRLSVAYICARRQGGSGIQWALKRALINALHFLQGRHFQGREELAIIDCVEVFTARDARNVVWLEKSAIKSFVARLPMVTLFIPFYIFNY